MIAIETEARRTGCYVGAILFESEIRLVVVYRKNAQLEKIYFSFNDDHKKVIQRVSKRSGKDWSNEILAGIDKWESRIKSCGILPEMLEQGKCLDADYEFWDSIYALWKGISNEGLSLADESKLRTKARNVQIAALQSSMNAKTDQARTDYLDLFRFIKRARDKYAELKSHQILAFEGILSFSKSLLSQYNTSQFDIAKTIFQEI